MKVRSVLLIIAGVLKSIMSGFMILFGLLGLLTSGLMRTMYEQSPEMLHKLAQEMANISEKYQYLLEATDAELTTFIMNLLITVCIVAFVWGLLILTLGIFNFLFVKHQEILLNEKKFKITLGVATWVLSALAPSTILTTIALCLGRKNRNTGKDKNTSQDIETFQV